MGLMQHQADAVTCQVALIHDEFCVRAATGRYLKPRLWLSPRDRHTARHCGTERNLPSCVLLLNTHPLRLVPVPLVASALRHTAAYSPVH